MTLKHYPYEGLCWNLVERIPDKKIKRATIKQIRKTAEEISSSSKTYDELCWLNAELEISYPK
jgi:hypothetical protein